MYRYGKRCVHIFFIELNPHATCTGGVTVHYTSFPIPVEDFAVHPIPISKWRADVIVGRENR